MAWWARDAFVNVSLTRLRVSMSASWARIGLVTGTTRAVIAFGTNCSLILLL